MLSITSNFTNAVKPTTKLYTSIKNNAMNFKGNIDGPQQDTFEKSQAGKKDIALAEQLEKRGLEAFRKKEYSTGLVYLGKALEVRGSAKAYFAVGNMYSEQKKYEEAIASYDKSLDIQADSTAYRMRGIAKTKLAQAKKGKEEYEMQKLLRSALDDFTSSYELVQNPDLQTLKGKVYMTIGDYKSAVEALDISIELNEQELAQNPDNQKIKTKLYDAYLKKGLCYRAMATSKYSKEINSAFEAFSMAINYNPNSAFAFYRRALVNPEQADAISDMKEAIRLEPNNPKYYEVCSNMLAFSSNPEDLEESINYLAQAIFLKQ